MRRSTRRSSVAMSLDSSIDSDASSRMSTMSTRRSSSILPPLDDSRNLVGNFTTKFSMSSFVKRVEELTSDQRAAIEKVGFGNLLRIHLHTLRKNLLVEMMERWDCEKRAFMLLDRQLTIEPMDVSLILGLRAKGQPVTLDEEEPLSDIEKEYGASRSNRKISVSAIERKLESLGDVANEDFVRTFLLFTFGTILFHNSSAKIDSRYLLLLRDLDKVAGYSWGVAVLEDLFSCLSKRKEEQAKSMEGCLILLQIWSYEHIDIARPNLVDSTFGFPRACRWESSRCTSQRHWFVAKFNELEENQVTWKLQLTATELDIDIIKEILEPETEKRKVHPQQSSSSALKVADVDAAKKPSTTVIKSAHGRLPPKSSCRLEEPKGDRGRGKLDTQDDVSENSKLSADISEITVEFPECSSSFNLQEGRGDENAETSHRAKEDYRACKECLKLKEDMAELRRENAALRNQLSLNQNFEETAKLRKEVRELNEENHRLRLPIIDRLESIAFQYYDGVNPDQLTLP